MAAIEAARRGLKVDVWERTAIMGRKVCGGFLSPESLPLFEELIPDALRRGSRIARAEFYSPSGRLRSFSLPAPAVGLSRAALDGALWRAASERGARCHAARAIMAVKYLGNRGWELSPAGDGNVRSRAVLAACGRWWKIDGLPSQTAGHRHGAHDWMGAQAHFESLPSSDAVELYFFSGGYCGLAPVEDGLYNACFLVHRSLVRGRRARLEDFREWIGEASRHDALACRLRGAVQVSATVATAPVRPARKSSNFSGALVAGDAAGFLDPFTGDGISIAAHSGRLAAREIARGLDRPEFGASREVARRYRRLLAGSVRRSHWAAWPLRMLVRAPAGLQNCVAAALPASASALLVAGTRWRPAGA